MNPLPPTPGPMPSLTAQAPHGLPSAHTSTPQSLLDLMADGFYLLLLLKRTQMPSDTESFVQSVQTFLDGVERGAV
ncbi:DotU family type IV/VI secretion system protein, partial [Xanthomonas oryzae pv. oryzae]